MSEEVKLYAINDTEGHQFRKNEVVRIAHVVSPDTVVAINDETGKYWAVKVSQLTPYIPITDRKLSPKKRIRLFKDDLGKP